MAQDRPGGKHDHECDEIECERDHPHEGRGRDIGRDVRGDRNQQRGRNGGEHDPARGVAPGRCGLGRCLGFQRVGRARGTQHQHAAPCDQCDQHDKQNGPAPSLLAEAGQRLHRERIGEQRKKAADVACRIEEVWIRRRRVVGAGEPGLQQRAVGGKREERQPDRHGEQPEQPDRGGRVGGRAAPPSGDRQRQKQSRRAHHHEMHDHRAAARQIAGQRVRVGVAGEQHGLEKHHRDRPHRGRAAEPRQHHLGEHRLHGEQQRRRQEDRRRINAQQLARIARRHAGSADAPRSCGGRGTIRIAGGFASKAEALRMSSRTRRRRDPGPS